jgi:hypothetical protein
VLGANRYCAAALASQGQQCAAGRAQASQQQLYSSKLHATLIGTRTLLNSCYGDIDCPLLPQVVGKVSSSPSGVHVRPRGRQYCVTAMAGNMAAAGPRRLILWFRNDLRLRDNVIVHQAMQKIKAREFDEVSSCN